MGLLGDIFSAGNTAKRRLRGLLDDPIGSMQQAVDNAFPTRYEAQNAISQLRGQQYNPDALQAYNTKLDSAAMNFAPMGITVWHGSPHKFNKFDMSKIGTGEGAQAYGHGLYMAENPNVAASYQEKLSKIPLDGGYDSMQRFLTYGKTNPRRVDMNAPSNSLTPAETALSYMHMNKGSTFDASQDIRSMIEMMPPDVDKYKKALKILESGKLKRGLLGEDYGNMYKVDIPDEAVARMLDWDKPLSQQPQSVVDALSKAAEKKHPLLSQYWRESVGMDDAAKSALRKKIGLNIFDAIDEGGAAYKAIGQGVVDPYLKQAGVPGIRYLDGGSRSAGQGSSNYVLFSDDLPRILEINGQATGQVPWKPNEWRGLLGGQ